MRVYKTKTILNINKMTTLLEKTNDMRTNKYIHINNIKAYKHFKELGCRLEERTKEVYACCRQCDKNPVVAYQVYFIYGKEFDEMSGRQFSRYLEKNNLLLKQIN